MVWHHGYVTEIQYTHGFYRELSPTLLQLVQLNRGVRAPTEAMQISYAELGCGQGFSTNLLAAANPEIQFYANDFNPAQIAGARRLSEEAGLANAHFYETAFEDFAQEQSLPSHFDIIALHGIYSWISMANRQHILRFIREKLKPGGLVYLSYNTLPGWASAMPLRRLLLNEAAKIHGNINKKIDRAIAAIEEMRNVEAGYFAQNPGVKARVDKLAKAPREYLAHEYLNADWRPEYFADVAADLHTAKCEFLGSAHINDHVDGLNLSSAKSTILAAEDDQLSRETLRDFLVNQEFRRDVFVKGGIAHTMQSGRQAWNQLRFVLATPRASITMKTTGRLGEIDLLGEVYNPILDAFAAGPITCGQLMDTPAVAELGWGRVQEAILVMVGANHLQPCLPLQGEKRRASSARQFNQAVLNRAAAGVELGALASPVTGGGIGVDRMTQLFILAHQSEDPGKAEWINSVLEGLGQHLLKDGQPIKDRPGAIAELRARYDRFERVLLPVYHKLRII